MQAAEVGCTDVVLLVFLEAKNKKPPIAFVRSYEEARSTSFAAATARDALLNDSSTKIRVDQTCFHFQDSRADRVVGEVGLPHPPREMPRLEYSSRHKLYHSVW